MPAGAGQATPPVEAAHFEDRFLPRKAWLRGTWRDPEDGRSHIVSLTDEGHPYLGIHIEETERKVEESFAQLAPEEHSEHDEAMNIVIRLFEKM